jgi:hypothetical protein
MTQKEKQLKRLRNSAGNVTFEKLESLLKAYGFARQPNGGGSHFTFTRKGCPILTVPFHRPVKPVYVNRALDHIERYGE